jgi:predicted nucleic-acid-binding Zn-ribbon protein
MNLKIKCPKCGNEGNVKFDWFVCWLCGYTEKLPFKNKN